MNRDRLVRSLKLHEGYRRTPYRDTLDFWTVGHGTLIDALRLDSLPENLQTVGDLLTWLHDPANHEAWFQRDVDHAIVGAERFAGIGWCDLADEQRETLAEMAYQLGNMGLWEFRRLRAAVRAGDFETARAEMLSSRWAQQTPTRARTLADRMHRPPRTLRV